MQWILALALQLIMASVQADFTIEKSVFSEMPAVTHNASGPFGSYLSMNTAFKPVKKLFWQIDQYLKGALNKKKARKEAHITVVTPVEYHQVLRHKLSIDEIHHLARQAKLQQTPFSIVCIGRGQAILDKEKGKVESTYYLVVSSPGLVEIRKKIAALFYQRGGKVESFDPELFYPHITIGYTKKDLHLGSHGVKKDKTSCWRPVTIL